MYLINRGNGVYAKTTKQLITKGDDKRFPTFELEDGTVYGTTWENVTELPEETHEDQADV